MRVIDLFAGCGGLSLGLQRAGLDVVAAFDNWTAAANVYRENFDHPMFELDLSGEIDFEVFRQHRPDCIAGGPPCQDFSSAGQRNENGGRADLTLSYAEIISEIRPEWFIMENVERITKSGILVQALEIFRRAGYGLTATVLDASLCGVPQSRKRYILIGRLGEPDDFLRDIIEEQQADIPMTVRDYLGDQLGTDFYYRHPRSYARRGIFSIDEPSPTIRGVNRPIPPNYQFHPGDETHDRGLVRALTTEERALIQTFPPDFVFNGTKSAVEQMLGNAVPVELGHFVGNCIQLFRTRVLNQQVAEQEA
ncbi:DNA cytosine methyltransferase [uncultured Pontibacter sp.]|uniref:DNA cytosine methyltransferase n=1 Tax=uncultured Pontibacter sp. TaxID=453356 RepID=UPI00260EB889|nr:DNA cytosine methyltransferase [uncultured Pontibacter sp.]